VLAVAPAGAQRSHGRGTLTVSQRFDLSKGPTSRDRCRT
jgi:hypothetical protein